ncbi:MAG TPA: hypothetical protein VFQ44_17045 [Streptosporangiaceae bacterium]|nr:hypothetical protein [Streptosporangiaceae bacterium]
MSGVAADDRPCRYTPVTCGGCGVVVHVAKFSPRHTSVQWSARAAAGCAEFAVRDGSSALIPTCTSLRDSIDDAVAGGRLRVGLGGEELPP